MSTSISKHQSLLKDHRWLLAFFASKNPWAVLRFVLPMCFGMIYLMLQNNVSSYFSILGLFVGFFYWTFFEYIYHRFFFHWQLKNNFLGKAVNSFHHYHHQNPKDIEVINSGVVTALIGLPFHFSIWFFLTQKNIGFTAAILLGFLITYSFYEWVHYIVHKKQFKSGIMRFLQEFHLTHHVIANKNFGQITPIWDYFLNTATKNKRVDDSKVMKSFIYSLRGKNV